MAAERLAPVTVALVGEMIDANEFGAFNANGITRTFFKPGSGAHYWANQPGFSPWTG